MRAPCSSVEASSWLCAPPDTLGTALASCRPADRPLVYLRDEVFVMVARQSCLDVLGLPQFAPPSTTGSAHRCRRPSLGYPTPFDCVWSRWHIAFGNAGGTPVLPHGLGYPMPFDRAGMLLRVLLLVFSYSTTCSPGMPACGVYFFGDTRLAVSLRSSR
jgi:hypothetical protein